jgi:HlyD family secretion protein
VQILDARTKEGWRKAPLKIGISNGQRTEVAQGISEGDKLVLP